MSGARPTVRTSSVLPFATVTTLTFRARGINLFRPFEVQVILGKKAEAVQSGVSKVLSHDDNYRSGLALLHPGGAALGALPAGAAQTPCGANHRDHSPQRALSQERGVLLESIAVIFLIMTSGSLSFELLGELGSQISRFVFLPDRTSLLFVYRQIHHEVLRFIYEELLFLGLVLDLLELSQSSS